MRRKKSTSPISNVPNTQSNMSRAAKNSMDQPMNDATVTLSFEAPIVRTATSETEMKKVPVKSME